MKVMNFIKHLHSSDSQQVHPWMLNRDVLSRMVTSMRVPNPVSLRAYLLASRTNRLIEI